MFRDLNLEDFIGRKMISANDDWNEEVTYTLFKNDNGHIYLMHDKYKITFKHINSSNHWNFKNEEYWRFLENYEEFWCVG